VEGAGYFVEVVAVKIKVVAKVVAPNILPQ
jgi:hypothetical protein